jgi:hypothetical protein
MAEKFVNDRRKEMNGQTGDQGLDKNTKQLEDLTEELREINRKGVVPRLR